MPTDPSDAIRDALRADEIGAADLRQPTMRGGSRHGLHPARLLAACAAALVVAAIAVTVSLVTSTDGGNPQAAGAQDAMAGVVGYTWRVSAVHDARGTLTVPRTVNAHIGFARTGVVVGNDGVNTLSGRYRTTATGYRVSDSATTLIGTVGTDPVRDRVTAAVDAMFAVAASRSGATDAPGGAVAVTLSGDTLTLRHGATALTLTKAGAQPDAGMGSGSSASPDAASCSNGRGFALSIAADARGAASPEAALKHFLAHRDGLGPYDSSAWSIRHTSADGASATRQYPLAVIELVRLPGRGWFAESGHTCD